MKLKFPNKSHRKAIKIPSESSSLAELIGIEFGDGGINNLWQVVISLNSEADKEYAEYVRSLIQNLFNIEVTVRKRPNRNTLVLICSSMNLVDYLVTKGAARGNKILQSIDMPKWIKGNQDYEKAFVRGLVDTDGCLFIHKHRVGKSIYRNLGFCFTSFSKKLTLSVAQALTKFGIKPHITDSGRRIYLYSQKSVEKYLNIFGSSNPRITKKYIEFGEVA